MKVYFAGPSGQTNENGTSGVPHGGRTWVARVSHLVRNIRRTVVARVGFPQIVAIVSAGWVECDLLTHFANCVRRLVECDL